MLKIKELKWNNIENLYNDSISKHFPAEEIKPLELIRKLYNEDKNKTVVLYDENKDEPLAYAVFEKPNCGNVWLLDYFAVDESMRGKGIGSIFLNMLKDKLKNVDAVMAEIECIDRAADDEQRGIRERRKRFYLKSGLCETGVITKADGGIYYEILCFPIHSKLNGSEAADAMKRIYETFFEEGEYQIFCGNTE